ncbi:blood vessel epicardial substance-like [Homarus americanus]|uniref:blood vessel epicardial substance-like n=1 Tax=Homarus americanus TaxID=6706 RepID=UPI001C488B96|nr:blood vessel epicardial substance-like [Homarus americanus]
MGLNGTGLEPIVTTIASILLFSNNLTDEDAGFNLSSSASPPPSSTAGTSGTTTTATTTSTTSTFLSTYTIRDIIRMGGAGYGEFDVCKNWLPINHIYFQLANIFLFLSYLAPNGIYGILYLRITLTIGCMFFSLWGWVVLCAFDTFLWNAIFVLINLIHVIIICYYLRPVRFTPELEQVSSCIHSPRACG